MIVICCGMYRAASTWQYNVACHLVERFYSGERLGYLFDGESLKARRGTPLHSAEWVVVKAHELDPIFAELISSGEAVALYSYRDLRDVAYSVAHKRNSTFEREIEGTDLLPQAIRNFQFWTSCSRSLSQRYEQIIPAPVVAVQEIAAFLGITLQADVAEQIATEFSLESNKARVESIAADLRSRGVDLSKPANALCYDEATQLHWNHIRDGSTGGWRALATPRHIAVLARGCGRWLIEQGYEKDWAWAQSAMEHLLFTEPAAREQRITELGHHLNQHRESLATLHEHLAASRAESATLTEQLTSLRQTSSESLTTLHEHLAASRAETTAYAEQAKASAESLTTLHQHLTASRAESAALAEQLRATHESLATLHEHLTASRAESTELADELSATVESLATLHEHLAAARAETRAYAEQVCLLR